MKRIAWMVWFAATLSGCSVVNNGCVATRKVTPRPKPEEEEVKPKPKVDWGIRGFALACRHADALSEKNLEDAVSWMKEVGINWIQLDLWLWQDGANANRVDPWYLGCYGSDQTAKDKKLIQAIQYIKKQKLKILLKPNVHDWNLSSPPRLFDPTDPDAWFARYTEVILHYATLAKVLGVEMLCIGNEFATLTHKYPSRWIALVDSVKKVYRGKLTYSSLNGSYYGVTGGLDVEYRKLGKVFWQKLDFVGINSWYPVSKVNIPTVDSVLAEWEKWKDEIIPWADSIGKKVIFTEIGYRSIFKCGKQPWANPSDKVYSGECQKSCYQGLFESWKKKKSLEGIFLFEYWPGGNYGDGDPGYTPRGKPAEKVLKEHFEG